MKKKFLRAAAVIGSALAMGSVAQAQSTVPNVQDAFTVYTNGQFSSWAITNDLNEYHVAWQAFSLPSDFTAGYIVLNESNQYGENNKVFSDAFAILPDADGQHASAYFISDGATQTEKDAFLAAVGSAPLLATLTETGAPQDVSHYFFPTGNGTALVQSDVDAAPEPAAWSLIIIGVGGIGASLRSRRRKAVAA